MAFPLDMVKEFIHEIEESTGGRVKQMQLDIEIRRPMGFDMGLINPPRTVESMISNLMSQVMGSVAHAHEGKKTVHEIDADLLNHDEQIILQ